MHVAKDRLGPIKGLPLVIGLDFGLTPAAIIVEGDLPPSVSRSLMRIATGMGIKRFADECLGFAGEQVCWNTTSFMATPVGVGRNQTDEQTRAEALYQMNAQPCYCPTTCWHALKVPRRLFRLMLECRRHF